MIQNHSEQSCEVIDFISNFRNEQVNKVNREKDKIMKALAERLLQQQQEKAKKLKKSNLWRTASMSKSRIIDIGRIMTQVHVPDSDPSDTRFKDKLFEFTDATVFEK
jgi:hypothetical protein